MKASTEDTPRVRRAGDERERFALTVGSASTLDQLKAAMKFTSLMDAFQTTVH